MIVDELLYHDLPTWVVKRKMRKVLRKTYLDQTATGAELRLLFEEVLSHELTNREECCIAHIEALRARLTASAEKIAIRDYGAGTFLLANLSLQKRERVVRHAALATIVRYSKPPLHALLLFKLIRRFHPRACLELGTCLGISAAYIGSALKLNGNGKLISLEGAGRLADLARRYFDELALNNIDVVAGPFHKSLPVALKRMPGLDFVFIDGHHDGRAMLAYLDRIKPYLASRAFLVFDDISWSPGMRRAWNQIRRQAGMVHAIDLGMLGLCAYDLNKAGYAS